MSSLSLSVYVCICIRRKLVELELSKVIVLVRA
jgi:hypothetical protein